MTTAAEVETVVGGSGGPEAEEEHGDLGGGVGRTGGHR